MESFISLENMISKISNTVRNESLLPSRMLKNVLVTVTLSGSFLKVLEVPSNFCKQLRSLISQGKWWEFCFVFLKKNQQAKMKTIHLKKTVRLLAFSISKVFCFSQVAFCVMFFQLFVGTCIIGCRVLADNSFHFVNSDRETLMT